MQTDSIFRRERFATGEPLYWHIAEQPTFQWHLTSGYSTPNPEHLRPAGIGWSDVSSTGNYVVDNLKVDIVDPSLEFLQMISRVLPTTIHADEVGDRLIENAIGNSRIVPISKRMKKK